MKINKLLVVDDDPFMHRLVNSCVAKIDGINPEILHAEDGGTAKEMFKQHQPEMVITDLVMPIMTGFDLTIYLKTSEPSPYVVAISSSDDHLEIVDALGPDKLINKQTLINDLPALIKELVSTDD